MRAIVLKTLIVVVLALSVSTAFAHQNGPSPGTHLMVAKAASTINPDLSRSSIYTTIQAAVNAAKEGQVIEILDEAEYAEQVTIDGRDTTTDKTRWPGVVSGKNGITIRYVPPSASATARPSIKYKDVTNQSPKTPQEATKWGDQVGTFENFKTNGALRIIRADGVKIEGIIVDGGGAAPFFNVGVWCDGIKCYPLFHGNAAIAVAVSGNIQIRDCELRNAYFGIAVEDKNTVGIFGRSPNPGDNDTTIALSRAGKTGYHLFEYNKIHDNSTGIFFESSWDRGSTVRYNLIYGNYHHTPIPAAITSAGADAIPPGGVTFKDNYLSPVAIYNNTFYDNAGNLRGAWQVGYQHLIFNNIFGKIRTPEATFDIHGKFPNRMKHCVFVDDALPSGTFPTDANIRRLEMTGADGSLFKSINATSPDFLVPNWDRPDVVANIRKGGYPASGIMNEDGTVADLGAIPYSGKRPGDGAAQRSLARISPLGVVWINGTTATASILVNQEVGSIGAMTIKYIRWIAPIPDNTDSYGNNGTAIPSTSIRTVAGAEGSRAITDGFNNMTFTVPALGATDTTGFFEVVLQGANGTTDVGFLPYRKLDYRLDISVTSSTAGCVTAATTTMPVVIQAGCPVRMTVTAMENSTNKAHNTGAPGARLRVEYYLALPAAKIWRAVDPLPNNALTYEPNLARGTEYKATYEVYFTKVGNDMISAAGDWRSIDGRFLPFLGQLPIRVKSGAPAKVVFQNPIPNSQLNSMAPPTVVGTYPVVAQVQDRFDNPVDVAVPVNMKSLQNEIGDVQSPTALVDAEGNARFTATVTYGATGEIFNLVASGSGTYASIKPDTGSLRVGRATDGFRVFYYQSTPPKHGKDWIDDFNEVTEVNALVGTRKQVWVKVRNNADTIVTSKSSNVCVTASAPNILFSATEGGTAAAGPFLTPLINGVASFWITSTVAVDNASLSVVAKTTADCGGPNDGGVSPGSRGGITFVVPDAGPSPPKVVLGRYAISGGVIESARVTFNRDVSRDWFSSVEFAFGTVKGTLTNMSCVTVDLGDAKTAWFDFGCAFPGTDIPAAMGNNSKITINFSGSYGWTPLTVTFVNGEVSVLTPDRVVPPSPKEEATVIAPMVILSSKFTAGPNPVLKQSGMIKFYRQGKQVASSELRIYDATGNVINKIKIIDNAIGSQAKRQVGSWDLKDKKGKIVSDGTYLVRGTLKTRSGEKEKISVILGVR